MALEDVITIAIFVDRATVWILALVYNAAGNLTDPTAVKISIIDPDGTTQVNAASMTKYDSNTGIYEYYYHKGTTSDAMATGKWRIEGDVIDGVLTDAIITPFNSSFDVE